ncbi:MAG: BamA/TamA family outer membrane protein, partial [Pseudomonadota bacterium]
SSTNVATTGPTLELDYRNDQFSPSKGTFSQIDFEYSDPIFGSSRDNPNESGTRIDDVSGLDVQRDGRNEINFFRTTFSTTHYTPLTRDKKWVWVNSLSAGYLKNVSSRDDSGIPRVNSFFLGGASTVRGYSLNENIPGLRELCLRQNLIAPGQDTSLCEPEIDRIFTRQESFYGLVKSELRFPISGDFGGLLFYDGGIVKWSGVQLEDPYRDTAGFGIRLVTPVGAFVVQMGYKLDRKLGGLNTVYDRESDFAIHLAIGNF